MMGAPGWAQDPPADSKDLKLTLEISRRELTPYEPVFYQLTLQNLSSRLVTLKKFSLNPMAEATTFQVRKVGEKEFREWGFEKVRFLILPEVQIEGGEKRQSSGELLYDELTKGFPLSEPGDYEVKAVYESSPDGIREETDEVQLTVRVPNSEEQAASEFIRKNPPLAQHLTDYGIREGDLVSLETLARYEKTLLGQYALLQLGKYWLSRAEKRPESERVELARKALEFLEKLNLDDKGLPFRAELLFRKGYIYGYFNEMETVRSLWGSLTQDYPNHPFAKKAQRLLEKLETLKS